MTAAAMARSQQEIAETSLAQLDAWQPTTDLGRRQKAVNRQRIVDYLARGRHPACGPARGGES